jgi:hypothetical protein
MVAVAMVVVVVVVGVMVIATLRHIALLTIIAPRHRHLLFQSIHLEAKGARLPNLPLVRVKRPDQQSLSGPHPRSLVPYSLTKGVCGLPPPHVHGPHAAELHKAFPDLRRRPPQPALSLSPLAPAS